jgi:hypothetical protein
LGQISRNQAFFRSLFSPGGNIALYTIKRDALNWLNLAEFGAKGGIFDSKRSLITAL